MKCLTVCQPWAWAILHAGKCIENRRWQTAYRGPLLVHAGKSRAYLDCEKPSDWQRRYGKCFRPEELHFGFVLGVVDLIGCLPYRPGDLGCHHSPWAEGPWCFVLEKPRALPFPYPLRGMMGLFDVDLASHPNLVLPPPR